MPKRKGKCCGERNGLAMQLRNQTLSIQFCVCLHRPAPPTPKLVNNELWVFFYIWTFEIWAFFWITTRTYTILHIIIIWTSNFWHVLYDMTELLNETRIVSFSINNYDYDLWNLPQQSSPNQNKQPMSTLSSILLHTWAREFCFLTQSHHIIWIMN